MGKKRESIGPVVPDTTSYTVVVPIFDNEATEGIVQTALHLAHSRNGRVVLVGTVMVPEGESLTTGTAEAQIRRAQLDGLSRQFQGEPIYVKPRIRVVYEPWRALANVVANERAKLVVMPWRREGTEAFLAMELDKLLTNLNCHLLVVSGQAPKKPRQILLPIRGSQEAPLMLEVALSLAQGTNAKITMLYATEDDPSVESQQVYRELARISQGNPRIKQELRVEDNVLSAILDHLDGHDLVILGASEAEPGHQAQGVGEIPRKLQLREVGPFMVVRTHRPPPLLQMGKWDKQEPLPATQTSVVVDKWFAENTFSSQEFKEANHLLELKEAQGLTISLGLPALNEEETIGNIIKTIKSKLMVKVPLLDEIVLIDSGSTDYTVDIALEAGLPVYQHSDILPQYGSVRGKGEALWKSLHVLKGDLIAWIDTDIANIHPRFVYGILGPLLRHDTIQYVKGFYRRPLKVGETYQAGGGGRVTELVARPLFNLLYPELSGLVQPLSGEYAGRREALERTPFYVGYGVETGLLLNLVERFGISGIAQVDLRQRIHHNQSLSALSQMAFAIIQVFIDHLERRNKVDLLQEVNRTMKIIRYERDAYRLEERPISDQLRPPIITIPEYRARHDVSDWDEADSAWLEEASYEEELVA
jgi:glycosyltransferase involved in cell wall biosynthesis/nucleotide-binding universal stress UspA family protein